MLVHQEFDLVAAQHPERIALFYNDQHITFSALNKKSSQLASHLRQLGANEDEPVAIFLDRCPELIISMLAILKAGSCYLPLDPSYPQERLRFILDNAKAKLVVADKKYSDLLLSIAPNITVIDPSSGTGRALSAQLATANQVTKTSSLAYIIYTSGSTGQPKGVMIEHGALANFLRSMSELLNVTSEDVFLATTTTCFDISILEIFTPLLHGAQLVLSPCGIGEDPEHVIRLASTFDVTKMQATPSGWRMLINTGWTGSAKLDVISGGEELPRRLAGDLIERARTVWNLYGPTEATVWATAYQIKSKDDQPLIGTPINNLEAYVLGEDGEPTQSAQGELCLAGAGLARGYLNQPQLTQEKFFFHTTLGKRLYRTGDVARWQPNRQLEFLGRRDFQVKFRGYRIELGEIEETLQQHPLVSQACVVLKGGIDQNQRLVAYVATAGVQRNNETTSIQSWQNIWDRTYSEARSLDPRFNISGWNDSYTSLPMPAEYVKEWVDNTVARILELKPQRVLEIGCGSGLLLFRIAPHVLHYHGTDISEQAVRYIHGNLGDLASKTELSAIPAHEIPAEMLKDVDLVIINSVLQYFPSSKYLLELLAKLASAMPEQSKIFLGDVRNLDLLRLFHTSVQLEQASDDATVKQLRARIDYRVTNEQGLLLSPKFFSCLEQVLPSLQLARIELKRGQYQNELTRFRYDALVNVRKPKDKCLDLSVLSWGSDIHNLGDLDSSLSALNRKPIHLRGIPNARITREVLAAEFIKFGEDGSMVSSIREVLASNSERAAIDPETLQAICKQHEFSCCTFDSPLRIGFFDAVIVPKEHASIAALISSSLEHAQGVLSIHSYANTPSQPHSERQTAAELREHLAARLPTYMIPNSFVVMKHLPLTAAGKLDRNALPVPPTERPNLAQTFILPRTPAESWITGQAQSILGLDPIGVRDNLFELGGDSLSIVELVSIVQKQFGITISLAAIFDNPTIETLADTVILAQSGKHSIRRGPPREDLLADANLPDSFWVKPKLPAASYDSPKKILLTGATGFLGAHILCELLLKTEAQIPCLVRGRSKSDGLRRIKANLTRYSLWNSAYTNRIDAVVGDLGQPKLGLNQNEYDALAESVDIIVHNGAAVNLLYPYSALRMSNVTGTREILDFAITTRLKRLHYVSSLAVLESPEFATTYETQEFLRAKHPELLSGGYAQSKWVSEELIWEAHKRGVPCSVSRPGSISAIPFGCNNSPDDLPVAFMDALTRLKTAPDTGWKLDLTPVTFVAQAIVAACLKKQAEGECLHLVTPRSVCQSEVIATSEKRNIPIRPIPLNEWVKQLIAAIETDRNFPLAMLISLFTEKNSSGKSYFETSSIQMQCVSSNTEQLLQKWGLPLAPTAAELIQAFFDSRERATFSTPTLLEV